MAQERKEPTFSSIKPERDEIATHQTRMSGRGNSGSGGPSRTPPPRPAAAKSTLAAFAMLFALVGGAAAGFSIWQLQLAQAQLQSADARIAELESSLKMTSSESTEMVGTIQEKLQWADSEIRKLWGVSYDTNRKAIQTNKDALANVDRIAKQAAADAKKANEVSSAQQATLTTVKNLSSEQQILMTKLSDDMAMAQQRLSQLSDSLKNIDALSKKLDGRVAGNEEAIKAIDAFRRTANADINRLKQQLGQAPTP